MHELTIGDVAKQADVHIETLRLHLGNPSGFLESVSSVCVLWDERE